MLALVPFIPALYGFEESSAWGIAAIAALVVMGVFLPGIAMRTKRMKRYEGFGARRNAFNFGLGAVAIAGSSERLLLRTSKDRNGSNSVVDSVQSARFGRLRGPLVYRTAH